MSIVSSAEEDGDDEGDGDVAEFAAALADDDDPVDDPNEQPDAVTSPAKDRTTTPTRTARARMLKMITGPSPLAQDSRTVSTVSPGPLAG
jgi:hypothetical protein